MYRKKPSELKLAKNRMDIYEKPDTQAKIAKLRAEIRADEKIALIENTIRRMNIGK